MPRLVLSVLVIAGIICFTFASSYTEAASIVYGDYEASDVMFNMVTEESSTDEVPLFGAPVATENSLAFFPTNFGSSAQNGASDTTDSQLRMTISAKEDSIGIAQLMFEEVGDFTLNGGGEATAMVGAAAFWSIVEIDGQAIQGPLPSSRANLTFDSGGGANGGVYTLPGDAGAATTWAGSLVIDVNEFLRSEGIDGRATKLELSLDNTLSTFADGLSSSFIKKKEAQQITITAVTAPVPEPTAALLTFLALTVAAMANGRTRIRRLG
jgi:hypothetical protein